MAANSRKVLVINLPFEQVVPVVEQALLKIGAKISDSDPSSGSIKAKRGVSLKSWGDNITISIARSQSGCHVDVLSECALPTQVIDWGSNENNIQKLAQELSSILHLSIIPKSPE
ncbi:MAG: hypothetical protein JW892_16225 [Anaerolineae bacterium]|nr:hypothetical protein [Anaerolineae bacterium]